jgi:hypothetical protein
MKISTTVAAGERGAFTIGHRELQATLSDLPSAAKALLDGSVTATLACLNANGTIQGHVAGVIDEDDPQDGHAATESINAMSAKYLGEATYPLRDPHAPEVRALFRIQPIHAVVYDPPQDNESATP